MAFVGALLPVSTRSARAAKCGRSSTRALPVLRRSAVTAVQRSAESRKASRREFIVLVLASTASVAVCDVDAVLAREKPKTSLEMSLVPVIRVRDSCMDLRKLVIDGNYSGNYADIRKIISTILKGNNLRENVRQAALNVDPKLYEKVSTFGREAAEYLSSTISYFDPMDLNRRPSAEYLDYITRALERARIELDAVLKLMPPAAVAAAESLLRGPPDDEEPSASEA